jgi:hypothetical protein
VINRRIPLRRRSPGGNHVDEAQTVNPDEATMKSKAIYVLISLALMSVSAQAWEIRTTCSHSRFYGSSSCRTVGIEDQPQTRDYAQEAEDAKARQQRIKNWEAFCKPTRAYDELGVVRLVYAERGCEFGRGE